MTHIDSPNSFYCKDSQGKTNSNGIKLNGDKVTVSCYYNKKKNNITFYRDFVPIGDPTFVDLKKNL
jgi:hypothetical protein